MLIMLHRKSNILEMPKTRRRHVLMALSMVCAPQTPEVCVRNWLKASIQSPSIIFHQTLTFPASIQTTWGSRRFSSLSMLIVFRVSPGDSNATCEVKADASTHENSPRDWGRSRRRPPGSAERADQSETSEATSAGRRRAPPPQPGGTPGAPGARQLRISGGAGGVASRRGRRIATVDGALTHWGAVEHWTTRVRGPDLLRLVTRGVEEICREAGSSRAFHAGKK